MSSADEAEIGRKALQIRKTMRCHGRLGIYFPWTKNRGEMVPLANDRGVFPVSTVLYGKYKKRLE